MLEWTPTSSACDRRLEGGCYHGADADATRRFCADHNVDCVYILVEAADMPASRTAQQSAPISSTSA